jgi:hypothetical protein
MEVNWKIKYIKEINEMWDLETKIVKNPTLFCSLCDNKSAIIKCNCAKYYFFYNIVEYKDLLQFLSDKNINSHWKVKYISEINKMWDSRIKEKCLNIQDEYWYRIINSPSDKQKFISDLTFEILNKYLLKNKVE